MFFPISDSPNPKGIPVATVALIAINVGIFVFVAEAGRILLEDRDDVTAAYQYFRNAQRLGPSAETSSVIRQALTTIEAQQRFHPGRVRR